MAESRHQLECLVMHIVTFMKSSGKAQSGRFSVSGSERFKKCLTRIFLAGIIGSAMGLSACGQETEVRKAKRLDVEGVASATLNLAQGPEERCLAMVDYVTRFTQQHAPAVYQGVSCSPVNPDELKLRFSVLENPKGKSIGEMIVYLRGGKAQFLLCQQGASTSVEDVAESNCSYLLPNERVDGLPQVYRKESLKVQDFVFSFAGYVQG